MELREDIEAASQHLATKLGVRGELKRLPDILWEGETVERLAAGQYSGNTGLIVLTDRRLIFFDKVLGGSRVEDFPLDKISSVQHSTTLTAGKMSVFASGNRAEITHIMPKIQAAELADLLRARINAPGQPSTQAAAAPSNPDPLYQLAKLAELRDAGIITPEDFDAKKKQLLGL